MKTLTELADYYKTDKGTLFHNYTAIYEPLLGLTRNDCLRLLEIGIDKGYSLKMWYDYFPNAHIFGYDIRVRRMVKRFNNPRFTTFLGDQSSRGDLCKLISMSGGGFDIIIDDGSHISAHIEISLGFLFAYLKSGGRYIIEDLGCSMASGTQGTLRSLVKTGVLYSSNMLPNELNYLRDSVKTYNFLDLQERMFLLEHKRQ